MSKRPTSAQLNRLLDFFRTNRLGEARKLGMQLASAGPADPRVLGILGAVHAQLGEYRQAEACFRTLTQIECRSAQHFLYLGLALVMQGRLPEAVEPFERVLGLQPDFAQGHMQMGCLQRDLGYHDQAITHFTRALELSPDLVEAGVFLGNLLIYEGRVEEARMRYDRALAHAPMHPEALSGKAGLLEKLGETQEAWQCLAPLVEQGTVTPNVAIMFAKLAPKHGETDRARELLETLLGRGGWAHSQQQEMHYALGNLNDKTGDYRSAFVHYRAANGLNPHPFDWDAHIGKLHAVMDIFPTAGPQPVECRPVQEPIPIFIVGMPRSGTSLIEQILASHPEVSAAGESGAMEEVEAAAAAGSSEGYPACLRSAPTAATADLADRYWRAIGELPGSARYVTDKLPTNYERLGLICRMFPTAYIIHAKRNPLDTCLSCYFQNFKVTHTYSTDLRSLGEVYGLYQQVMAHWHQVLPARIFDVQYENLIDDPEATVRALLKFCGLPWDPRCLEFHKLDRYVKTASYDQVRRPIYRSSVERWKNYEGDLGELIEVLGATQAEPPVGGG